MSFTSADISSGGVLCIAFAAVNFFGKFSRTCWHPCSLKTNRFSAHTNCHTTYAQTWHHECPAHGINFSIKVRLLASVNRSGRWRGSKLRRQHEMKNREELPGPPTQGSLGSLGQAIAAAHSKQTAKKAGTAGTAGLCCGEWL